MTPAETAIPLDYLRESLNLDPTIESGVRWRTRPRWHFADDAHWRWWNARYAEKPAGWDTGKNYWMIQLTFDDRERHLLAHRVVYALTHGHWPEHEIDHENGVEAGNSIANLRSATHGQNSQNQKLFVTNTSGFPGVHWHKQRRKWKAEIAAINRPIHLGLFDTPEEAYAAYLAAKAILHIYSPTPRGVTVLDLHAFDRMATAHRIVKAARRFGDSALELNAWSAFIAAM
jgi:hypothetical protein